MAVDCGVAVPARPVSQVAIICRPAVPGLSHE